MNEYSKAALLQRLPNEEMLYGWGAALAIGGKALNTVLQDQFLNGLGGLTYMQPFTKSFSINEGDTQLIDIEGLVVGKAQVSFEHAVFTDRLVTVSMSLLAGDYRYLLRADGSNHRLHRSLSVRESMGYILQARCKLSVQTDPVSLQRHVLLDLRQATDFSCNLGENPYEQTQIGKHLGQWLVNQPEERLVLRLATIDLRDYRPLTSTAIELVTLPAPWAGEQGYTGEGALVMFMQLGVDLDPGILPPFAYPYLLPKGDSSDIALVVHKQLQELALGSPAQVLLSLQAGNRRRFILHETEGQISFGQLQAGPLTRELMPALTTLQANQQCRFSLAGASAGIDWSAQNLSHPLATGSIAAGLYNSGPEQAFVKPTQLVLVTGHAQGDAEHLSASALVVEHDQPAVIAPQTANWATGHAPIEFVLGADSIPDWTLEGETTGTLSAAGKRATFTPAPPDGQVVPIRRQRVRASYNDNGLKHAIEACVVMVNTVQSLSITPAYVPRSDSFQPIQFGLAEGWQQRLLDAGMEISELPKESELDWTVIGEGKITTDGLYTPPLDSPASASVVRAYWKDIVSGYAIVEHGPRSVARSAAVGGYTELSHFYVTAMSAPKCYANGMQQIELKVDIRTKDPEDGTGHSPISPDDLQSLRLFVVKGGELKVVEVGIEPPPPPLPGEEPTPGTWVMNRQRNLLLKMQEAQSNATPAPAAPGQTILSLWVQTTLTGPVEIYAMFKKTGLGGTWFNSMEISQDNGKVGVQGLALPSYIAPDDYAWGIGEHRVRQEGKTVGDDTFSYMTLTVDYWKLSHVIDPSLKTRIPFVVMDIQVADNRSTVLWASDGYDEVFCSYSGFMLGGTDYLMIYDGQLAVMGAKCGVTLQAEDPTRIPAAGELVLSLNRVSDFRQRFEQSDDPDNFNDEHEPRREKVAPAFRFRLLDEEGNRHFLQVAYTSSETPEGRNTFLLSKQP